MLLVSCSGRVGIHAGLIIFRGIVRSSDYGYQARLLTGFWKKDGSTWDWQNRIVYLPKSF